MAEQAGQSSSTVGSVFDLPNKSYQIVKNNWKLFAFVNIFSLLSAFVSSFNWGFDDQSSQTWADTFGNSDISAGKLTSMIGGSALLVLLFISIAVFFYAMTIILELHSAQGKTNTINSLLNSAKKYFFRLFGLGIVAGAMVILGLIAFIVPGVIIIGRVIFSGYIMIDKDLGIADSLRASNKMVKEHTGPVWSAIGLTFLISIAGSFFGIIPIIGSLAGAIFGIAYSLILALRYVELKTAKQVV